LFWQILLNTLAPSTLVFSLDGALGLFSMDGKIADVKQWLHETDDTKHEHEHEHHDHSGKQLNHHNDRIQAFCVFIEAPIPETSFNAWLAILLGFLGHKILRLKAILNIEGQTQPVVIQGVQHLLHPVGSLAQWPTADQRSRLVFITEDITRVDIEKSLINITQTLDKKSDF
jgi:G3E family GTPase